MTQKNNILNELNELGSKLPLAQENVYVVPAGYFDGLAEKVLKRIKAMEAVTAKEELGYLSPLLTDAGKQIPYTVPSGYFEGLASAMLAIVKDNSKQSVKEELESISPLLSGLKKEMPFSVPEGYFESLTKNIATEENKPVHNTLRTAKVVSLTHRKWFRYAAAAMMVGVIAMAGMMIFGGTNEPGKKALAKFTRDVKKMNDVQKDDLIDFIDAGLSGEETAQVTTPVKSDEVKNLLQGISEEELKDFQEQTEDLQDVLMTN